jgi:hypothetical protein
MKKPFRTSRPNRWANGPSGENRVALTQLMRSASERLFETLSMPVTYSGEFPVREKRWDQPVSILPFTGQQVAGSLLLAAPVALMVQTTPSGEHTLEDVADWSRELANLLAGSLKTALMQQGIIIELGIPASVVGGDVRIALPAETGLGLVFCDGTHMLHLVLDGYLAEDVEIRADEDNAPTFDVLLF